MCIYEPPYEPMLFNACIVMIPLFNERGETAKKVFNRLHIIQKEKTHTLYLSVNVLRKY